MTRKADQEASQLLGIAFQCGPSEGGRLTIVVDGALVNVVAVYGEGGIGQSIYGLRHRLLEFGLAFGISPKVEVGFKRSL